jgi:FMN phosphatase YigB (HAD superfamily)
MIKNIIFDVDGVLVDFDRAKFNYIKATMPEHRDLKFGDLTTVVPLDKNTGITYILSECGIDGFGKSEYCYKRPVFDEVFKVLDFLKNKGINLFCLSAAVNPQDKLPWLNGLFGEYMNVEVSPHGISKKQYLLDILNKYDLKADETLFVDDMLQNIRDGIAVGLQVLRMQPKFYLPLPADLSSVQVVRNLQDVAKYIFPKK